MADPFVPANALGNPAENAAVVTPNDSTDLADTSRALYISGAGDLRVTMRSGQVVTFTAVAAGVFPVRVTRVHATGTAPGIQIVNLY